MKLLFFLSFVNIFLFYSCENKEIKSHRTKVKTNILKETNQKNNNFRCDCGDQLNESKFALKDKIKQVYSDFDVTEELIKIGSICDDSNHYEIYISKRKIKAAIEYKYQSHVLFINKNIVHSYYVDSVDDLPISLENCVLKFQNFDFTISEFDFESEVPINGLYKEKVYYNRYLHSKGFTNCETWN
jgi:hypothetical protein